MLTNLSSRCRLRVATAFAAGLVVAVSASSWATFQYVGKPFVTQASDLAAGSTVYLAGPIGKTPFETKFPGMQAITNPMDPLVQKGAGIAWPCRGSGSGTLNRVLYHLLPPGWKIYAKPGVVLGLPAQYACHNEPWTVPVGHILHEQGLTGTVWWGYDVLSLAPQDSLPGAVLPMPSAPGVPQAIQPGGPMIPAKVADSETVALPAPVPVAQSKVPQADPKDPAPKADHIPSILTIGANGKVIPAGWKQHVIPVVTAMREGWKLALPQHPSSAQIHLAQAWMQNGGALFRPISKQG